MRLTILLALLLLVLTVAPALAQGDADNEAAGLTFRSLTTEELDAIAGAVGYRFGVEITAVQPNSAGAAAGYKPGDLILAIGKTGVDSADKAVAALKAASGEVDCASAIKVGDKFEAKVVKLKLAGGGGAAPANDAGQGAGGLDPVSAYFDLMDFLRTQAWGRPVVTPLADRQRVGLMLIQGLDQMDAATQAQIAAIPQSWAQVQASWAKATEAEKQRQKTLWADAVLLPGNLYAPPAQPQTYTAPGNAVVFEYPGDWTGGLQEIEGTPFLFVGPGGAQANWQQVFDTPNSPPGALLALADIPAGMQAATYVDGARALAQLLIPNGLSNLREIQALPIGEIGAVITVAGKFPGQTEEKFYWIGVTKFGEGKIFAGRMGGKVAEADTLIPAFSHILGSLQLNPPAPAGGGGGGASGAWEAAWSRVDVAITKNIWAPSGN